MGTYNHLWSIAKRNAMAVVIGISISDRYVAFTSVTGESMYPTFTASSSVWGGDFVLAEKRCIEQYKFSHGDVILFNVPFGLVRLEDSCPGIVPAHQRLYKWHFCQERFQGKVPYEPNCAFVGKC